MASNVMCNTCSTDGDDICERCEEFVYLQKDNTDLSVKNTELHQNYTLLREKADALTQIIDLRNKLIDQQRLEIQELKRLLEVTNSKK
jgi:hypothetical protein